MIYTGYFAKARTYPQDKIVSIALWAPKGMYVPKYPALYPAKEILSDWKAGKLTEEQYTVRYYDEVLDKLDPHKVARELNDKILCCYERNGDFCHRHLVRYWLEYYGYEAEEWNS